MVGGIGGGASGGGSGRAGCRQQAAGILRGEVARIQECRRGIHKSAAADPARRDVSQCLADEPPPCKVHFGDCSGGRPHSHGDPRSLECRSGRGRTAEEAVTRSDDYLPVRPQVDEAEGCVAPVQVNRQHSGEYVAPDEPPQAREKAYAASRFPSEILCP